MSDRMPTRFHVTMRTHHVFGMAHDLAAGLGHADTSPLHILLAIVREGKSPAVAILSNRGVRLDQLEREVAQRLPQPGVPRVSDFSWATSDEQVLERAALEARELGHPYQGCEHILLAFLRNPTSTTALLLERHGVRLADARAEALRLLGTPRKGASSSGGSAAI